MSVVLIVAAPLRVWDSWETDQVVAGQRGANLLHAGALAQPAEVNDEEPGFLEQRRDLGLGIAVVARNEDHALATGLVRVGAQYAGPQRVGALHHPRGGYQVGNHLARRAPVKVAGVEVVGRVDHDLPVPPKALDGLGDARP